MQTVIAALIVIAAATVLGLRLWRNLRAGASCSCSGDCTGCAGCVRETAERDGGAGIPPAAK